MGLDNFGGSPSAEVIFVFSYVFNIFESNKKLPLEDRLELNRKAFGFKGLLKLPYLGKNRVSKSINSATVPFPSIKLCIKIRLSDHPRAFDNINQPFFTDSMLTHNILV